MPRRQEGAIEHPGGRFQKVTVEATRSEVVIPELGWRLRRAAPPSCLARRAPVGRRNVGRVRLGLGPSGLLRSVPPPRSRGGRSWRWCVDGSRGKGVVAVFRAGRIVLVATTAPGHGNRGVRPGARAGVLRRVHPGRRTIGRGVVRAGPRSPLLFGVRRGRIRWVAVASPGRIDRRRLVRAYLRSAGLARR